MPKNIMLSIEKFANEVHHNDFDKGGERYINHVKFVADECYRRYRSLNAYVLGYIHDTVEDHPKEYTFEKLKDLGINDEIIEGLKAITKTDKNEPYFDYIKRVSKNQLATMVKIVDLEHNMDVKRLKNELTAKDMDRIKKYHHAWLYLKNINLEF